MALNFEDEIKQDLREKEKDSEKQPDDIGQFIRLLIGNIQTVIIVTLIGFALSAIYYYNKPDLYISSAKILVEKVDSSQRTYETTMSLPTLQKSDDDYYGTQIDILTSRKMTELVRSELADMPVRYKIEARRMRSTRIILVSVTYTDPIWAAKIANRFSEIFVRESLKQNQFISEQILKLIPGEDEIASGDIRTDKDSFNKSEYVGSLSNVTSDQILQKLRSDKLQLEAQIKELSDRYKPQHPSIREANEKLDYVNRQIHDRTQTLVGNLTASLKGKINVTNIKVLEDAVPPKKPAKPNRPAGITFGTTISFFCSILLVFLLEHINQRITVEEDINEFLGVPFLGYVPLVNELYRPKQTKKGKAAVPTGLYTVVNALLKSHMLSDAIANVRTHILFSMAYEKSSRIMFTSSIPDEGKSTVAALVAVSLATLGKKVLLIDADLRRPFLHSYFDLKCDKGLTNYLVGSATLDEILIAVTDTNLKIITGGSLSPNPSELLSSERFRDLLDMVSSNFDKIIIDAPPTLYMPDGLIIAKFVHSCVLVCGANMVDKKAAKTIKDKFDLVGGKSKLIGAVINRVNYVKEGYRYRYYQSYNKYYSTKTKDQKNRN